MSNVLPENSQRFQRKKQSAPNRHATLFRWRSKIRVRRTCEQSVNCGDPQGTARTYHCRLTEVPARQGTAVRRAGEMIRARREAGAAEQGPDNVWRVPGLA